MTSHEYNETVSARPQFNETSGTAGNEEESCYRASLKDSIKYCGGVVVTCTLPKRTRRVRFPVVVTF